MNDSSMHQVQKTLAEASTSDPQKLTEKTCVKRMEVTGPNERRAAFHSLIPFPCEAPGAIADRERFSQLNGIVETGIRASLEAGFALKEIRSRKLYRAGGYRSWSAYCKALLRLTSSHINRLIGHAEILLVLREAKLPANDKGDPVLPLNEAQTRPLTRLESPEAVVNVWRTAVVVFRTKLTAKNIKTLVEKHLATSGHSTSEKKQSLTAQRAQILSDLRVAVDARESWETVGSLLERLESELKTNITTNHK